MYCEMHHTTDFQHMKRSDLYWQALIDLGNKEKQQAEQLAEALNANSPIAVYAPWKDPKPKQITDFYDRLLVEALKWEPETITSLGLLESIGIETQNRFLNDYSLASSKKRLAESEESYKTFLTYEPQTDTSYQVFRWTLANSVKGAPFLYHSYPVTQMFGVVQSLTTTFILLHPLNTEEERASYIERLKKIPEAMDQVIDWIQYQQKNGIVPPRFAVEKSIAIIDRFLKPDPKENVFVQHFAEKGASPEQVKKAETTVQNEVYPAYKKLRTCLRELQSKATENRGVWSLPNGASYYTYALNTNTTTQDSPEEIHPIGLKEVAKIQGLIRKHLQEIGLDDPDRQVGELIQKMAKDPSFYYPDTDEGRQEALADFKKILARSRKQLWPLFDMTPKAPVQIIPVPKSEENGAPMAYYNPGSIDGDRPGTFSVNLGNMKNLPKFAMEVLTVHEAEPGHHFQISLQNETDMPLLQKLFSFNAYAEGWALYTERLAYEQNFYSTPYDQIGYLQFELLRSARLVVDTAIHHKKWTREQAIAYLAQITGDTLENATSEVERYFVLPGQACSYKIGQLKILELRKLAQDRLGDRFDIRQFHNQVLKIGAVPLDVLEKSIKDWIEGFLIESE